MHFLRVACCEDIASRAGDGVRLANRVCERPKKRSRPASAALADGAAAALSSERDFGTFRFGQLIEFLHERMPAG